MQLQLELSICGMFGAYDIDDYDEITRIATYWYD